MNVTSFESKIIKMLKAALENDIDTFNVHLSKMQVGMCEVDYKCFEVVYNSVNQDNNPIAKGLLDKLLAKHIVTKDLELDAEIIYVDFQAKRRVA
jgi:hypothetical protein